MSSRQAQCLKLLGKGLKCAHSRMHSQFRVRIACQTAKLHGAPYSAARLSHDLVSSSPEVMDPSVTTMPDSKQLPQDADFFTSTRYRYVVNEEEELAQRYVPFNVRELVKQAALVTGSRHCTSAVKGMDGSYNRVIILRMDNSQEVVVKIPTQKAGLPHYTTASEVATMEFARSVLGLPVPKVLAWNSHAASSPVGVEYIIMEKAPGVPLSTVWDDMAIEDRAKLVRNFASVQEKMAGFEFESYGSLYFVPDLNDIPNEKALFPGSDHIPTTNARFIVGPSVGRDWIDDGRGLVEFSRGPWRTVQEYKTAIGLREIACVEQVPKLPTSWMLLYGRGTYQRSRNGKIIALHRYLQLVQHLLPLDHDLNRATLWHADTHGENIFVDPANPADILAIIDWQSTEVAPLFEFARQPGFLDHDGPPAEGCERPNKPDEFDGLDPEAKAIARKLWIDQTLEVYYRKLIQQSSVRLQKVQEFCDTSAENLHLLARHLLVDGEAHYLWCIKELESEWENLPAVRAAIEPAQYPFTYSCEEAKTIERDVEDTQKAMRAMDELKKQMGADFPDRGAVMPDQYSRIMVQLNELKKQFTTKYGDLEWPFDG